MNHRYVKPPVDCYGCMGTGEIVGFGQPPGIPCSCLFHCINHDDVCIPEDVDEPTPQLYAEVLAKQVAA